MPVRRTSRTPLRRKQGSPSNRLGALAIALAAISVVTYIGAIPWSSYVTSHPDASPGKLAGLVFVIPPMAAVASAGIGIAALLRARRGAGGRRLAIVGFLIGALLMLALVAWSAGVALNGGALGG